MFALLSMILLEFACRVCSDKPGVMQDFERDLSRIEPLYFTPLPGTCNQPGEFLLPGQRPGMRPTNLLSMIFDLLRNGKAHQYSSMIATLKCGHCVDLRVGGPTRTRAIQKTARKRAWTHLRYDVTLDDDLLITTRPDQMFLDIKHAIQSSKIITNSASIVPLVRPRPKTARTSFGGSQPYDFTVAELIQKLRQHNHKLRKI